MADKVYTYLIATDFGGALHAGNFDEAIRGSEITRSLRGVSDDGEGNANVAFVGAGDLSQADLDLLQGAGYPTVGGLIAAHDSVVPPRNYGVVQIDQTTEQRVYPSPRPADHKTYFSSAGDDTEPGDGELLIFDVKAADPVKVIDISYLEQVLIKDGYITCKGAPLGSTVSAEMYLPDGVTKVGAFVMRAAMLGDARMPFDTEDYGVMPAGIKLRMTVTNSDGTGEQEPAADFQVVARVEMYRLTTT
jgi:hypothetical protein